MNYEEALQYIHGISWEFCKPGLARISELCAALGNPQDDLKFVHVAGTNGKGSFCSMLSSVLRTAGFSVGLYTSPYIVRFNERMQMNGKPIEDALLAELTSEVKPIADKMTDKPTEFELITAIAFLYFKRMGADIVVLEAGMGGRLDSTNVISTPILSVITGISKDHTAFLGDTVEKIAGEKAGIVKTGVPVLFGGTDKACEEVIRAKARHMNSELLLVDYSSLKVKELDLCGTVFDYKESKGLKIKLLGAYQSRNASVVCEAVSALCRLGLRISDSALRSGILAAKWQARFEIVRENPLVIFDGAHNPEGISGAVESIRLYFNDKKVVALSGVLSDKDYEFIADELSGVVSHAFTVTPDNKRALSAEKYAKVLNDRGCSALPCDSIGEAVRLGMEKARELCVPLVCLGSLYTYADVIKEINNAVH